MKTILILLSLACIGFGQTRRLELEIPLSTRMEWEASDLALQKSIRDLTAAINDANFRVETDATGRPLYQPSQFYTFRSGDPTKYTGDLRTHFADEIRAAYKAKAYAAAWQRYNTAEAFAKAQAQQAARPAPAAQPVPQEVSRTPVVDPATAFLHELGVSYVLARKLYPEITKQGSPLERRRAEIERALLGTDPLRSNPDYPLLITIRAANQLGVFPSEFK